MSLQNILETSAITKWLFTEPTPLPANAHPSSKVIAFEADHGETPHSLAANLATSLFLTADQSDHEEIAIRKGRDGEEIWFDKRFAGRLATAQAEAVRRRLMFLSGYLEYPSKPNAHQIRVNVHGHAQVWICSKLRDSLELKRVG